MRALVVLAGCQDHTGARLVGPSYLALSSKIATRWKTDSPSNCRYSCVFQNEVCLTAGVFHTVLMYYVRLTSKCVTQRPYFSSIAPVYFFEWA